MLIYESRQIYNSSSMSFLDKFKGKTTFLTKGQASQILGDFRRNQISLSPNINSSFTTPSINMKPKIIPNNKNRQQKPPVKQVESPKLSPFYVSNPFYLDENQKQKHQKAKRDKQIQQRLQWERKRRRQLQSKLAQFQKSNKERYKNKEWIKLGGLGPNIGSQEWKKKSQMHSKMMKFAQQIKEINFSRLKCVTPVSYSNLSRDSKIDSRTKALQYSRSIPKPTLMTGSKLLQDVSRYQSIEQSQLVSNLERSHQDYVNLIRQM